MTTEAWEAALGRLRFSFQPIALASNGRAYGYEALLRGWKAAGFFGIGSVFDAAFLDGALAELDRRLRAAALADFASWAPPGAKLFYNVDNRIFKAADDRLAETAELAASLGLSPSRVVLEISERHEIEGDPGFDASISRCRDLGFRIAIDDFGSGYAGLKLLRLSEPDIVKIDRHFVAGAGGEPRIAAFLEKIVGMSHLMGVPVVAEGIETEAELAACVESGCDMLQGFLLARPAPGGPGTPASFPRIAGPGAGRRGRPDGRPRARARPVEPVAASTGFLEVLARFRKDPALDILPAVGVYLERDFRQYVYSPYGISLLEHLESGTGAASFLRRAPVAAEATGLARLLEVYAALPAAGGVILTRDSRYAGLLPASELLALLSERELSEARDQNPLTRLPGNLRVSERIARAAAETARGRGFGYFDFDDFKPFNDRYGFRQGDRVIQLFADILRSVFGRASAFVGHLGGDDFFSFDYAESLAAALAPVAEAARRFRREASSFYSAEDRERGWILGRDRSGAERRMPLIGVSAALVFVPRGSGLDAEALSDAFAELKKEAKLSESRIACREIEGRRVETRRGESPPGAGEPRPADAEARPAAAGPATLNC